MAIECAGKHDENSPTRGWFLVRELGEDGGLVEAEASDVGFFDGGGVVGLVFGEGDGEVLDAVGYAEAFEEHDEFAEFFSEKVDVFVRGYVS